MRIMPSNKKFAGSAIFAKMGPGRVNGASGRVYNYLILISVTGFGNWEYDFYRVMTEAFRE